MASSLSTLTSGFFPSNNHDRLYTSDQLANLISALITDGAVQGSSGSPDSVPFKVSFNGSDNTAVTVGKGLAWLQNTWTSNTAIATLSMTDAVTIDSATGVRRAGGSPANNGNPRWDAIAIEVNKSTTVRANTFVVVEGVPSSNPARPDASTCNKPSEGRYYYALAFVYRPAGSGYVIGGQTSDKLVLAVAQNGGIPYITSLVSEATSIDDLLVRWNDEIDANLAELRRRIDEAGSAQIVDGSVVTSKLAESAVTNSKIAGNTIAKEKLAFPVAELTDSGKIQADNASSDIVEVTANTVLSTDFSGKTLRVNSSSPITLTVPSTVNWAIGTEMEITKWGIGTVTLVASNDTKYFSSSAGETTSVTIGNQYGVIVLKMMDTNKWLVAGDIG